MAAASHSNQKRAPRLSALCGGINCTLELQTRHSEFSFKDEKDEEKKTSFKFCMETIWNSFAAIMGLFNN